MPSPTTSSTATVVVRHEQRSRFAMGLKRLVQMLFLVVVTPRLLSYSVAKMLLGDRAFLAASESIARIPGMRGVYCRQAFYRQTLHACGQDCSLGWMSTFSMPQASIADQVYIGRRCSIGYASLGAKVMLADGVQILSGGHEHGVGDAAEGETHQDQAQTFEHLEIGEGAWIGTNAVIMADVGAHAIVGAGAVVTKPIPPHCVAAGVPARVIKQLNQGQG